uniref:Uncharacterized protein n=1 Tax=Aegilops tauschii subsp. strangulata TaxID=200361 RepID=A0A453G174_AEGTS
AFLHDSFYRISSFDVILTVLVLVLLLYSPVDSYYVYILNLNLVFLNKLKSHLRTEDKLCLCNPSSVMPFFVVLILLQLGNTCLHKGKNYILYRFEQMRDMFPLSNNLCSFAENKIMSMQVYWFR